MTLNIGMAVPREYVLMTCDSSIYACDLTVADTVGEPVHDLLKPPPKVGLLSRWSMVANGGCIALAADFRRVAAERMEADDDVDDVYAKVRDIVDELRATDRPGERYEIAGTYAVRGSVDVNMTLQIVGFRRDGTAVMIQFGDTGDGVAKFQDYDGEPDYAHFTCGVPHGVPVDDVLSYYVILEPMPLRRACRHALALQHQLHTSHADRVTSDCNLTILAWDSEGGAPLAEALTVDVTSPEITALVTDYVDGQRTLGAAVTADIASQAS